MENPVITALQQSSKGKLDYEQKLRNQPSLEKLDLLDKWNSFPPLTPNIEQFLSERARRATSPAHEDSATSSTALEDVDFEDPLHRAGSSFKSTSFRDTYHNDWQEYEQSLEDRLHQETSATIQRKQLLFSQQLQERVDYSREEHETKAREQQTQVKQSCEAIRLADIRWSVTIEEWKHETIRQYREEEERIKAKLIDGEKRLTMLRQEQMEALCEQYQADCELLAADFITAIQSCTYPQYLQKSTIEVQRSAIAHCRGLQTSFLSLKESSPRLHEKQVNDMLDQFNRLKLLLEHTKVSVQEANVQGTEQAAKEQLQQRALQMEMDRLEEERRKQQQQQKLVEANQNCSTGSRDGNITIANQTSSTGKKGGNATANLTSSTGKRGDNKLGMPNTAITFYTELQNMLSCTSTQTISFSGSRDSDIKKYRFDLQKAINITINSISANSGEVLIDKITKLRRLLGGQSINVMGKAVDTSRHPQAKLYCCNLLAQKLVKQGEDQVSSNMEAAFPMAAVAIALWSSSSEVGKHMLAHFHSMCPCLVPLYIHKTSDMTDTDLMKLQGYKLSNDGQIESEDMFLHRMRGIVRLYAAIVTSPPPPTDQAHSHPHGLEHGWKWLARVLNMEPHPTLTAASLGDFLEIAGHALMRKYGVQFQKLLKILCRDFIPKMEKCTPSSQRGPISRLTQFLENCMSRGKFLEPKGYLHTSFWRTQSKGIALA